MQQTAWNDEVVSYLPSHLQSSAPKSYDATNSRGNLEIDIVNLTETLTNGYDSPWTSWRDLNKLRTGYTCSKGKRHRHASSIYQAQYTQLM